ncbi:MAG: hypothetical protein FWG08_06120, partial [Propionibacteriaceae bacterium]|nr:hypothetical protein [Propionibacteriaceae bacterium]
PCGEAGVGLIVRLPLSNGFDVWSQCPFDKGVFGSCVDGGSCLCGGSRIRVVADQGFREVDAYVCGFVLLVTAWFFEVSWVVVPVGVVMVVGDVDGFVDCFVDLPIGFESCGPLELVDEYGVVVCV